MIFREKVASFFNFSGFVRTCNSWCFCCCVCSVFRAGRLLKWWNRSAQSWRITLAPPSGKSCWFWRSSSSSSCSIFILSKFSGVWRRTPTKKWPRSGFFHANSQIYSWFPAARISSVRVAGVAFLVRSNSFAYVFSADITKTSRKSFCVDVTAGVTVGGKHSEVVSWFNSGEAPWFRCRQLSPLEVAFAFRSVFCLL